MKRKSDDDDSIPTRASLLIRLKDWDDNESWRDFFDTYWRLLYGVAVRAGLTDAEAEDAVQETVVEVAKKMRNFKYDPALGSFKGWLKTLTKWRVTDHLRKRRGRREPLWTETGGGRPIENIPDEAGAESLERIWEEEWRNNLKERATELVKAKVSARQYQMFQLYANQGLPVKEVAAALRVSSAQVYVTKHHVSQLLKKEIDHLKHRFENEQSR